MASANNSSFAFINGFKYFAVRTNVVLGYRAARIPGTAYSFKFPATSPFQTQR